MDTINAAKRSLEWQARQGMDEPGQGGNHERDPGKAAAGNPCDDRAFGDSQVRQIEANRVAKEDDRKAQHEKSVAKIDLAMSYRAGKESEEKADETDAVAHYLVEKHNVRHSSG